MTEKELQQYLLRTYPREDSGCDWKEMKNLRNSFSGDEHKDVISYLSGISNMEGGQLVIGVADKTLDIVGTDLSQFSFNAVSVVPKMVEMCPNLPSEGLRVEEFVTADTAKVVWVIHIPKHLPRRPVLAHRKKWQRIGDSLELLTREREDVILNEEIMPHDWSAEIVEDATIADLDERAVAKAREGFCRRFSDKAVEVKEWSVKKFLDKARVTINGKITRTALLLLGKEESAHYLNHIAEMDWKLQTSDERVAKLFYPPFLITAVELRNVIRNYEIKIFPTSELLPLTVPKYEQRSILEALHNCILHQDYTRNERIVVTETADCLTFKNAGAFYDGNYKEYIETERTPVKYRNPFLQTAMVNLKMIDSQGFGIRDMFESQKSRYLPMPDYDQSTDTHVVLSMPGRVINEEYSTILMENANLSLTDAFLLDRVQRGKLISKEDHARLKGMTLVEGRYPHPFVSRRIARITHREVEYTNLKGFDNDYYKDLIVRALREHGHLTRANIDRLLMPKLPATLNDEQRRNRIEYLLKVLRKAGKIKVGAKKCWELGGNSVK